MPLLGVGLKRKRATPRGEYPIQATSGDHHTMQNTDVMTVPAPAYFPTRTVTTNITTSKREQPRASHRHSTQASQRPRERQRAPVYFFAGLGLAWGQRTKVAFLVPGTPGAQFALFVLLRGIKPTRSFVPTQVGAHHKTHSTLEMEKSFSRKHSACGAVQRG